MSHGNASNKPDPAKTLRDELRDERRTLLRQRDQYVMAMDTATDPKVSIRLQRTLERIEEEIEGLDEALRALPAESVPKLEPGLPDWDEEPSTAIYDPDQMRLPVEPPSTSQPSDDGGPSSGDEPIAAAEVDAPDPTPSAASASAGSDDATKEPEPVPPPVEAASSPDAAETDRDAATSGVSQAEPAEGDSNPLGPVWMDGLGPPTGQIPDALAAEQVANDPQAQPNLSPNLSKDAIDAVGDDPFALPGQPSVATSSAGSDSPFPAAPSSMPAPVSILDDDDSSSEWGWGARVGLVLGLGLFLAGVFYVLSIN